MYPNSLSSKCIQMSKGKTWTSINTFRLNKRVFGNEETHTLRCIFDKYVNTSHLFNIMYTFGFNFKNLSNSRLNNIYFDLLHTRLYLKTAKTFCHFHDPLPFVYLINPKCHTATLVNQAQFTIRNGTYFQSN